MSNVAKDRAPRVPNPAPQTTPSEPLECDVCRAKIRWLYMSTGDWAPVEPIRVPAYVDQTLGAAKHPVWIHHVCE